MSNIEKKIDTMTTLTSCLAHAKEEGFLEDFGIAQEYNPRLYFSNKNQSGYFSPEAVIIKSFYRFEGQSDPGDNSILYLLETANGVRGTLVTNYGASPDDAAMFMLKVEQIEKAKLSRIKENDTD